MFSGKRACFLERSDLGMQRRWKGDEGIILEKPSLGVDLFFSSGEVGEESAELERFRERFPEALVVDERWIKQCLDEQQLLPIQKYLLPPDRTTSTSNLRVDQFLHLS